MARRLDFWFEFASTYSYPAAMRVAPLADAAGVAVRWRPFLLGPIFKAQGWDTSPFNIFPEKGRYMWRDMERTCGELGLPFAAPGAFPQNSVLAARVALIALDHDWGIDFCRAVYRAEFGDGCDISEPATIAGILAALGRDADAVIAQAQSGVNKTRLREETERARAHGVFGAPAFVAADGEMFWGNDRLETALAWARKIGDSSRLR